MQSPEPTPRRRSTPDRSWRRILSRTLLITSSVATIGAAAGMWWLHRFVTNELSPLLSRELSKTLDRPVVVGAVEGYSLTGVRVGQSSIPATGADPDHADIAAIAVTFNPLQLLTRNIDLHLTLVEPTLYLEQEQTGVWVRIPVQPEQPPGFLQSRIASVRVDRGRLSLSPAPRPGVARQIITFTPLNGTGVVTGRKQTEQVALNINLNAATGGGLTVQGDVFPAQGRTNLQLRMQQVALAEIGQLIQKPLRITAADADNPDFLPVILQSGQATGIVTVQSQSEQFPRLMGTVDVTDAAVKVIGFPEVITVSKGRVRLQGERLQLENVTGEVAGATVQVAGHLNTQYLDSKTAPTEGGTSFFDLTGQVQAVNVASLLRRLGVKLPLSIGGRVQGDFQVTGAPQRPVFTGGVTTATPLKVDRLTFANVRTAFRVADGVLSISSLQATLSTGGTLTGDGRISLSPEGTVKAKASLTNVDGDQILKLYEAMVSPGFTLGKLRADGQVSGSFNNLRGDIRWRAPMATYPGSGRIVLAGDRILFQDTRLAVDGGTLQAQGEIRNGAWQATVTTDTLQLGRITPNLQGTVSGRIALSGRLDALRADDIRADGDLLLSQGLATVKQPITAGFAEPLTASFTWDGQQLLLRRVNSDRLSASGSITTSSRGNRLAVTGLNLALRVRDIDLATLLGTNGRSLASGLASFTGQVSGNLTNPNVTGVLAVNRLGINQPQGSPIRVNQGIADFSWNGQRLVLRNANADGLIARGIMNTSVQGGIPQVTSLDVQVLARDYDLRALPIPASTLQQAGITALGGRASLDGRITGTLTALTIDSTVTVNQLALSRAGLSPLRVNQLAAALRWDGRTLYVRNATADDSSLSGTIATNAQGGFPSRITALDLQLSLRDYEIAALPIQPINTPQGKLTPQGRFTYAGRLTGSPNNLNLSGTLTLNRVALNRPTGRSVVAWDRAIFNGGITGAIATLRARGNLQVENLQALGSPFERSLAGTIDYTIGKGGKLSIAGQRDRITVALGADNLPTTFYVKRDQSIAEGNRQGDRLQLSLTEVPITDLQLQPVPGYGAVAGIVSGTLTVNLRQGTGFGRVTLKKPALGHITADSFSGNVSYLNGVVTLTESEFQIGQGRYAVTVSAKVGAVPQFNSTITIANGTLNDLFTALKWFDLTDIARGLQPPVFDRATDLLIYPVGSDDPNTLLNAQLQRLSEIDKLLSQQIQAQRSSLIPDLRQVQGTISGTVNIASNPNTGLTATFDLQGANWQLTPYQADQVTIKGDFKDDILTLQPLRFSSTDGTAFLTYAGPLSLKTLSGQVRFQNLPLDNVITYFELPLPVSGKLNGTVALSGKLLEPRLSGQLGLVDGLLNDEEIERAIANFNYGSRRVNFRSVLTIQGPEPLVVEGSLPAALPFDLSPPTAEANRVALKADLNNEGLALLNIFSKQFTWVEGKGNVSLEVNGDLEQATAVNPSPLVIRGTLALQDASFRAQGLPDIITNVTGNALFTGDRLFVESIEGRYNKGRIAINGSLPISKIAGQSPTNGNQGNGTSTVQSPSTDQSLLMFNMADISLNIKGKYRGQANGTVQVTGGVLNPILSGNITLTDGIVFLAGENASPPQSEIPDSVTDGIADSENALVQPPEFDNLRITLGNRVVISSPPLLSFVAKGNLFISGTFADLKPTGTIRLEAGQVNIGLAQLNLARGFENTAIFTPRQGLDPTLNIRLITSVQEVFRRPIAIPSVTGFTSSEQAELPAGALGALQTVRIRAEVNGPASQLQDKLTLTSSPPRSREELIALLGGTSNLERGDSRSLEILAGTVLLTQLQGLIGNAIGLTDFRLFPTLVGTSNRREDARRSGTSSLGLAAEIGTDITDNLSVSLLQVLGSNQPTQYNLRYRVSDQFLLRGSTDFAGDSRAVIEFSTRF